MSGVAQRRTPNAALVRFALVNVAGGAAVLASYAWGLARLGDDAGRLWGDLPASFQPIYRLSMWTAAAGYFPMTAAIARLFVAPLPDGGARSSSRDVAAQVYAVILVCSAAWLPLTCLLLEGPSWPLWWTIRLDLAAVGLASLAVLGMLLASADRSRLRAAGIAGAVAFCIQTALLDAVVWPAYFGAGR